MYQQHQLTITDTRDLQQILMRIQHEQIKMTNHLYSSNNTGKCKIMTYKNMRHNQQVTKIVRAKFIVCYDCFSANFDNY